MARTGLVLSLAVTIGLLASFVACSGASDDGAVDPVPAAVDTALDLPAGATKADLLAAMEGHILAGGVLVGERQGPTAFEKTTF